MRIFTQSIVVSTLAFTSACGYDFATEGDRFECAADDDCVDGYKCAGHTSLENDTPVTFCVKSTEVEIAIWQETLPAFGSQGCTDAWEFDWEAWMVVSPVETPQPALPPEQSVRDGFIDAGGTCVGSVSPYGAVRVMCRREAEPEQAANTALMWVVIYEKGADYFASPQQQLAVAFSSAVVDPDTRLARGERHHRFDDYLGDESAECNRAILRTCNSGGMNCGSCVNDDGCPVHYVCTNSTCEPAS